MLHVADPVIGEQERSEILKVISSGMISSKGSAVKEFEQQFSKVVNTEYCIATSSGTGAIHATLKALGIGPGDEVIVPNLTFIATITPIIQLGATPFIVDISLESLGAKISKESINKKTKAILPVALSGFGWEKPTQVYDIAKEFNIPVVGDLCQALGSQYLTYKTYQVNSIPFGVASGHTNVDCYSLFANKIITTGEGGMVTTNDPNLAHEIRLLINQGVDNYYYATAIGFNYRMTALQAAIGIAQLKRLEKVLEDKRVVFNSYSSSFFDLYKRHFGYLNQKAIVQDGILIKPSKWMFRVYTKDLAFIKSTVLNDLKEGGIEAKPLYPPITRQTKVLNYCNYNAYLPQSQSNFLKGFYLPTHGGVTPDDIDKIVEILDKSFTKFENKT